MLNSMAVSGAGIVSSCAKVGALTQSRSKTIKANSLVREIIQSTPLMRGKHDCSPQNQWAFVGHVLARTCPLVPGKSAPDGQYRDEPCTSSRLTSAKEYRLGWTANVISGYVRMGFQTSK